MTEVVSKCGMNCAKCPWSPIRRKGIPDDEYTQFRMQAKKILGFTPTEKPCLLCLTPEEKIRKDARHWHARFRRGCQVRKCVTNLGIKNCAYCSRFPCAFEKAHAGVWTREHFEKKHGRPLTEEEYHNFIEPFEALKRLERIRSTLKHNEIVEAITVPPLKMKVVEFPDTLSSQQTKALKPVHSLLSDLKQSTLGVEDSDLPPQQHRLKKRIKHFSRFLWIFAAFGKLEKSDGGYLVVDPQIYHAHRGSETGLTTWSFLEQVIFPILAEKGVQIEFVELDGEWQLPMGGLQKHGWEMKLSFSPKIGEQASLMAYQNFGDKLQRKYKKRAFRFFSEVDMRIFTEA